MITSNMKYICIISLMIFFGNIEAQKVDLRLTNKITVNRDSDYVYAYTLPSQSHFEANLDKFYYWYSGGTIKATRGGYDGKLLNGKFTCFYHNKNLEEKGHYKSGLKHGKWVHWYRNGEIKSIYRWKKGKLKGKSFHYDSLHNKLPNIKYRHGQIKEKKRVDHFFNRKRVSVTKKTPKDTIQNFKKKSDRSSDKLRNKAKPTKTGKDKKLRKGKSSTAEIPSNANNPNVPMPGPQEKNTQVKPKEKKKKEKKSSKSKPSSIQDPKLPNTN